MAKKPKKVFECEICGCRLTGTKRKYCSKACYEIAKKRKSWDEFVMRSRAKSSFTIDDYFKLCEERKKLGLPRISYGKAQAKRYFEREKAACAK